MTPPSPSDYSNGLVLIFLVLREEVETCALHQNPLLEGGVGVYGTNSLLWER